jgi:type IV pilus assembly protein PilP
MKHLLTALAMLMLVACTSKDSELTEFIERTKAEAGGAVQPIRQFKPFESVAYGSADRRSPFMPGGRGVGGSNTAVRPNTNRAREFLEQFSLDTLKMVGTLELNGVKSGLLRVPDGRVHRITNGNYVGQNDGKVVSVSDNKISLIELVPDGTGGYIERAAAIGLEE